MQLPLVFSVPGAGATKPLNTAGDAGRISTKAVKVAATTVTAINSTVSLAALTQSDDPDVPVDGGHEVFAPTYEMCGCYP